MRSESWSSNVRLATKAPVADTLPPMIDKPFVQLVESLASKTPTPGGGAAAALAACMGAGLLLMVVRFSRGRKGNEARDGVLADVELLLDKHLQLLMPMAERDCKSFDLVSCAYKLPKDNDQQKGIRERAVQEAMFVAMVVPEEVLCMVRDVFVAASGVIECVGKNIASDLASGAALLIAAAEGAHLNVRINAVYLTNREQANKALDRARAVRQEIQMHQLAIVAAVEKMLL